jgi:hypothetical protein
VLASVALDAGIMHEGFHTSLVMLALRTSVLAGSWLQVALRRGQGQLLDDQDDKRRPQQLSRPASVSSAVLRQWQAWEPVSVKVLPASGTNCQS